MKRKDNLRFLLIILGIVLAGVVTYNYATRITPYSTLTVYEDNIVPSAGPPAVSITNPQNGQTVNGIINIIANATASAIMMRMEIKIDGQSVQINTTTTSLLTMTTTFVWNTSAYSEGNHTIFANATDVGGNSGNITIWVIVQNSSINPFVVVGIFGVGVVALVLVGRAISARKTAGTRSPGQAGSIKAFNPQPEPPGKSGNIRAFNPQPEPPGKPGNARAFNPQPEPPGKPGNARAFNPQPEPPGKNVKKMKKKKQIKK